MRSVLEHGDLSDVDELKTALGLSLTTLLPDATRAGHYEALIEGSPDFFTANALAYVADVDQGKQQTLVTFRFGLNHCDDISSWAATWWPASKWPHNVSTHFFTDAAGQSKSLQWPGPNGMRLEVNYISGSGCVGRLDQTLPHVSSFHTESARQLDVGSTIATSVASILATGDLRRFDDVNAALQANFAPVNLRNHRFYRGSTFATSFIPGIPSSTISYSANDSGWQPQALFVVPVNMAPRTVDLGFAVDTRQVCVPPSEIFGAVDRAGLHDAVQTSTQGAFNLSLQRENLITLHIAMRGACVATLDFHQITDIANEIPIPLKLKLPDSIGTSAPYILTEHARAQIASMLQRIGNVAPSNVFISQTMPHGLSALQADQVKALAALARNELIAHGIEAKVITVMAPYDSDFAAKQHLAEDGTPFIEIAVRAVVR